MGVKKPVLIDVNYIYFGAFLSVLVLTSLSCIFAKQNLSGSLIFFSLYAMGQALLETGILLFFAWLIRRFLGEICFKIYIGATFLLGIFHVIDFLMERILDLSVWETLDFVLDESWESFLFLLDASGIPSWAWVVIFLFLGSLPLIGIWIHQGTEFIAKKSPYFIRRESVLLLFICTPAALLLWDLSGSGVLHPDAYTGFIKSLPWKVTFFRPHTCQIALKEALRPPRSQEEIRAAIEMHPAPQGKLPNIYLFVIESFRADCITPEIAPHLHAFKEGAAHFKTALSNANGSHISWYSLFHSQFPFHWKQEGQRGSPPLTLLKKWGYQIRLYSSAQLGYYGMDEQLFGVNANLLSSYQKFHHKGPLAAWETDTMALSAMQKDIEEHPALQSNQVFIVFWDATHFDYSWPREVSTKFTPYAQEFAYFKAFQSKRSIELIKNRYRNAVDFIDSLFGKFLAKVPDPEHAIILVTGDHGEEFFEHGHLFHGSHLSHEQTHIPLYMRFGLHPNRQAVEQLLASQMDLFPSLIDYLSGTPPSFTEGHSIFRERKWPFAVSARFNASRTPYQFCLNNGREKLTLQFSDRKDIFRSKNLQVLSLTGCQDQSLLNHKLQSQKWESSEFGRGLELLFDGHSH